jgi:hypothetical protein
VVVLTTGAGPANLSSNIARLIFRQVVVNVPATISFVAPHFDPPVFGVQRSVSDL